MVTTEQTTNDNHVNLEQVCSLNIEQSRLLQKYFVILQKFWQLFDFSHINLKDQLQKSALLNVQRAEKSMWTCITSAVQKIQKLSESPATAHMVAKLCVINCKNRKITQKLVQPV